MKMQVYLLLIMLTVGVYGTVYGGLFSAITCSVCFFLLIVFEFVRLVSETKNGNGGN